MRVNSGLNIKSVNCNILREKQCKKSLGGSYRKIVD